ncbi:PREDICTED: general transcription factor 3C polypeptide 6-like isoform X3 [Papilio xuthus]|uniref:General transcription factor 3C polypeptide 6-like isoform X3 n=1 Tax=Papilio xuthus TaxID=66420 RepID=A0AAJ6Z7C5_PAPXU|nr:PREDICTED: general transcription factor 3C polypeptide 6-like isoform X3 [Papilio xuthus]
MNTSASDSEEEVLVYAEFKDTVNIEKYKNIHVLGIDRKNPVIQLDDTFFTGTFENPLGTYLFFEEDQTPHCDDPLFDKLPEKNLKYLYKTNKLLSMEHAYVTSKEDNIENKVQQLNESESIEPVSFENLEEALETFKKDKQKYDDNELKPELKSQQSQ